MGEPCVGHAAEYAYIMHDLHLTRALQYILSVSAMTKQVMHLPLRAVL